MLPINDKEESALIWYEISATELNTVLAGQRITGAEPIDPSGFLLYLEEATGSASVLEITSDLMNGGIFATIAKRKQRESKEKG